MDSRYGGSGISLSSSGSRSHVASGGSNYMSGDNPGAGAVGMNGSGDGGMSASLAGATALAQEAEVGRMAVPSV
jgi:hypothetical protein